MTHKKHECEECGKLFNINFSPGSLYFTCPACLHINYVVPKEPVKKKKYLIYGIMTSSKLLGEVEAETKEQAIALAENDTNIDVYTSLCHQCADEIELGEVHEFQADEKGEE